MRNVFFELLKKRMGSDERLFVVTADMGFGLLEAFQQEFPDRYLNVGIAEQNMAGICAGLCNAGFRPFCYTISNFLVERCFEQLRNDVCLHDYPVTFVGTSTGFDNGGLGPTHHVVDDVGCVKALPNVRIYSPSTVSAMRIALEDIMSELKPAYLRIGKGTYDLSIESNNVNHMAIDHEASDILCITHGNILENIVKGIGGDGMVSVYCMNKLKPLQKDELAMLFNRFPVILVIEDQFAGAGLYNSLCQVAVESGFVKSRLLSIAPKHRYEERVGDKNYFSEKCGLSPGQIGKFVAQLRTELTARCLGANGQRQETHLQLDSKTRSIS